MLMSIEYGYYHMRSIWLRGIPLFYKQMWFSSDVPREWDPIPLGFHTQSLQGWHILAWWMLAWPLTAKTWTLSNFWLRNLYWSFGLPGWPRFDTAWSEVKVYSCFFEMVFVVCEFHITSHLLYWASGGGATNSPSHVLYICVSYSC